MNTEHNKLLQAVDLQNQGKIDAASYLFGEILSENPNNAVALYSLAIIFINSGNYVEALRLCNHGVNVAPNFAHLHFARASVLQRMGQKEDALASYDRALQIDPDYIAALINCGVLLRQMYRHHDALQRFNHVLTIDANNLSALSNCAIILTEFKQSERAIEMFERLIEINPDFNYGLGNLCYERLHICDWRDYQNVRQRIIEGIQQGRPVCSALAIMSISDEANDHFQTAKTFARHAFSTPQQQMWRGDRYQHNKIRVAYVSPDLREHPVGHLMAGVFENHDKSRFEIIAISLGIDDQSRLRARMLNAFDRFVDARLMGSQQIAQLMRDMEVDIAVDLGGYTSDTRSDIFTFRPAPVQVNFLGYPGTMAIDCIDYIIADRYVIPEEQQQFYSEKVVYLPDCYLPTDSSLEISDNTPTRAECGLPENGFVFCSFSHDYKISPAMFDIWMRLLQQVPNSVLWLMSRNELSQRNLRKEAEIRGVDPDRLIFAQRVPLVEDHLARYRQADLFLDTHPYNAHTTAADALMAGLPVLTYMGNAFPSRVAGSLLHAIGVPELVTYSYAGYEALALRLAREPETLANIKSTIAQNKLKTSVFNTKKFCEDLENVYIEISENLMAADRQDSVEIDSASNKALTLVSHDRQAADFQPVMDDTFLNAAFDLFRQGNLPQAELFLRQYLSRDAANPIALGLLEDLRRGYGMADDFELSEQLPAKNHEPRYLLIKAWGYGFWSEAHHLASQLLLAELTGRTPIVLWGENCLFRHEGDTDAFVHFFQPVSTASIEDVPPTATIYPAKWNWDNLRSENVNKWDGQGSRMAAQYLFDRSETLVVSDFFSTLNSILPWIGRSSCYYGMSEDALYAMLFRKYLKPVPRISAMVEDFVGRHMTGRPWVAVHMRGSDKILESPGLAQTNAQYYGFVDRIVELNPTIGVFLLTDSTPMIAEFSKRYGSRLLCTQASRSNSNVGVHFSGHDGVLIGEEVLVDVLLATRCDYFIGNQESNVSLAIASLRDWPKDFIFLLGEKNGRTENAFLHNRTRASQVEEPPLPDSKSYQIGKHLIQMPCDHKLDEFQRVWRRYDQPIADIRDAIFRARDSIFVIDIGANVGDTAACICQYNNAYVLAIEGNPAFLPYLRRNARQIGPQVVIAECFIGASGERVAVRPSMNAGTASVGVPVSGDEPCFTLKSIEEITAVHPFFSHPDLIKIDTDGSDFQILKAMNSWLATTLPSLFFEFDPCFSGAGVEDGLAVIDELTNIGYSLFIVFDNYGNPLCEIDASHTRRFAELCNWLVSNRKFGTAVWYIDVLAVVPSKVTWLDDLRTSYAAISVERFYRTCANNEISARSQVSPRRIAIDGVFFRFSSGISRLWRSLLAEWSANGFGKSVVVIDRARTAPRFAGINYVDAPLHNYADRQSDRRLLQEICDREHISLFISTYYTTPISTPAVLMVPDMIPEVMGFDLDNEQWREKHEAIRYCRNYLSISNSTAADLRRFFPQIAPEQVITAYCGTDFRAPEAELVSGFKKRYGIDRPYFLISGAKSGYKNALLFFQAFARLGEHRGDYAIVCTNSPPVLEQEFADCVGEAKVFLLVLSDDDLQCAYAGALALAYPSRYEGFGLPVLEAMACSCPVITCNNSSIAEVAGDAAIYVDPDDPDDMLKALSSVQQENVRDELLTKGHLQAAKFSWRKMADEVEAALSRWALSADDVK